MKAGSRRVHVCCQCVHGKYLTRTPQDDGKEDKNLDLLKTMKEKKLVALVTGARLEMLLWCDHMSSEGKRAG